MFMRVSSMKRRVSEPGFVTVALAGLLGFAAPAQANTAMLLLRFTPVWVFPLFFVLLGFGLQALRFRPMAAWRPWILPIVFIGWGLVALAGQIEALPVLGAIWAVAAVCGYILARVTTLLRGFEADRTHRLVRFRRNWGPLLRILVVFSAKYVITAAGMLNPDIRDRLALYDAAISGAMSGYFIGWLYLFLRAYRSVESSDLSRSRLGTDPVPQV